MLHNTFFKSQQVNSIEDLIEQYAEKEFKSPFRSTIPLICAYSSGKLPTDIFQNPISKFVFEYEVPVKNGKGYPSCSDLYISNEFESMCIEAKRTEPMYETVQEWLGDTENRKQVLQGWCDYISEYTGKSIGLNDVMELPYQMLHRAASACAEKKERSMLVYIGFDLTQDMVSYYQKNLLKIGELSQFKIEANLFQYELIKFPLQSEIESRWNNSGDRDFYQEIKAGMIDENLFDVALIDQT